MNVKKLVRTAAAFFVVLAVYSSASAADPNLIAHWQFDEGEGTIAYDSAGDNDGTLVNGPVWTTGILNGALDFDGVDDYLEIPDNDSLNPSQEITLSFWIFNRGGQDARISKWASCPSEPSSPGNSRSYSFLVRSDGHVHLSIYSAVSTFDYLESVMVVPLNQWHHVSATFNAGQAAVYIDGWLDNSKTMSVSSMMNDVQPLILGGFWSYCDTDVFVPQLNGVVDEVRIYDRALSGEEIEGLFAEGLGSKAYWPHPVDGAEYVDPATMLGWQPGEGAASHDVYLGTDYNDVNDADTLSAEFMDNVDVNSIDPCGLELATTYYWRIDEVNGPNTVKGDVWSFTTWLEPNLMAWWKFDEGEGDTAYDSAGNNDGTLFNGPEWSLSGINGSLIFDGADDYVDSRNDASLHVSSYTLTAWIKPGALETGTEYRIISNGGWANYNGAIDFLLDWNNKLTILNQNGSGQDVYRSTSTTLFTLNKWAHVTATYSTADNIPHLYLNGAEVTGTFDSGSSLRVPNQNPSWNMHIGTTGSPLNMFFDGSIDDVRIYNRALSAEEVAEIYRSATPVNYYYADGVDGDDLNDGQTPETAFEHIQTGIDAAEDGDTVLVYPDVYVEELDFDGKAITVAGFDEPPVLTAPSFYAVSFFHGEDADSIFRNFIIKDSYSGFLCLFASPTISNVTVVDCNNGVVADEGSDPVITNSIFWNNTGADLTDCVATYSYVEDAITDGLVAHWKFDEGTGTTAYDSVGGHHGTIYGAMWTTGQLGGALEFDGDHVSIPDSDDFDFGTGDFSISVWFKTITESIDEMIVDLRQNDNEPHIEIYMNGHGRPLGNLGTHVFPSNARIDYSGGVNDGQWHNAAITFDNGTTNGYKLYLDGINVGQTTSSSTLSDWDTITIGGLNATVYPYHGTIDDVQIYSRALSDVEIEAISLGGSGEAANGPLFVDPENGDYHLKSEGWRWAAGEVGWTWDEVTSPCIDYGNPGTPLRNEPMTIPRDPDNIYGENIRVNMGAYGGTSQASMPPHGWALLADLNNDGVVGIADLARQAEDWVSSAWEPSGDLNRDGVVSMADFALLAEQLGQATTWAESVNLSEYWPFAVGNQWVSEVVPDSGFTLDITDHFFVNGFEIWEFTNRFGTFYGEETLTSYYVYVAGTLYATDNLSDLDSLPEIAPGLQQQYPEVIPVGGVVGIPGVGMTTVRRGDLSSVLEGTGFAVEDFPLGYQGDVIAFVSLDAQHLIVFARGLGPMRITFSNDFCCGGEEFFIASATVVE